MLDKTLDKTPSTNDKQIEDNNSKSLSEQIVEQAKTLSIRLQEGHKQILSLDLPAECVRLLSQILPDQVKALLTRAGIDLEALEETYAAGPITQGSVLVQRFAHHDSTLLVYLD